MPPFRTARAVALLACFLVCQGFYCSEKTDPPTLPGATLTDIHLLIKDPSVPTPGIYLAWTYPEGAKATYFEILQSLSKESLRHAAIVRSATDSQHAILPLPDSSRPFTMHFAVRAVYVEPTGQKMVSDSLPIDSISVTPSLEILEPASNSFKAGRALDMEVQTSGDDGVAIRFFYYERSGGDWGLEQEGWLPLGDEPIPIFGRSVQRGSLTLEQVAETDTVASLYCVVGTESFQERNTGQIQSLGCTKFFRVGR